MSRNGKILLKGSRKEMQERREKRHLGGKIRLNLPQKKIKPASTISNPLDSPVPLPVPLIGRACTPPLLDLTERPAADMEKLEHMQASSSPPSNLTDMRKPVNVQTPSKSLPPCTSKRTITDYPAQKKGGRGRRKKGEEVQVMTVKPLDEHFRALAKKDNIGNMDKRKGGGGTPKRKDLTSQNSFESPAKRRKLSCEFN